MGATVLLKMEHSAQETKAFIIVIISKLWLVGVMAA
jgi:hypothetical protein